MGTTTTETSAMHEARMFKDLAQQAVNRANALMSGETPYDPEALSLARIIATAIEENNNLGVERGSDWTFDLFNMMSLLSRRVELDY